MTVTLTALLKEMVDQSASDLHITTNSPPQIRIDGVLHALNGPAFTPTETKKLAYSILTDKQKQRLEETFELDLSFGIKGLARFRGTVYHQRGAVAAAFRQIPYEIKGFRELGLPPIVQKLCEKPRGLVLVTGPTGSGKSTTLAAMIDKVNSERSQHIVTIEDPVEFEHVHRDSVVEHIEVSRDVESFGAALRSVIRQDPDVLLIGEMRDAESMSIAITAAETGHLVLSTLHTGDSAQTIHRILDSYPPAQIDTVRVQLSISLAGIVSQQLLPCKDGAARVAAVEVLMATNAVRNLVRQGKIEQLRSQLVLEKAAGMLALDRSLAELVQRGLVEPAEARARARNLDEFEGHLRGGKRA